MLPVYDTWGVQMKTCFKCGELKELSCFYKHKMMGDGHLNKCKECTKKDVHKNRVLKIDYYREYDRDRGARQDASYLREYRAKYPRKYAAHKAVINAIKAGVLFAQPCSDCHATENIHAHHDDYAHQLQVRWLCAACHKQWHVVNGEGKNGS